ncbi:hypothetical protein [Marinifilum caeruleilacunae]|uniref:SPOR domain-containing protein n=1 Tax=Marinifilum caeruleilacunae TaxID=2499076 RepID=A0ABX1WVW2_9BACT|nr:hypothetical protein [Marinifilum caeruleilacunae]NOU60076.1 hypothetical protein [Marinifilum caeruleilacunae]
MQYYWLIAVFVFMTFGKVLQAQSYVVEEREKDSLGVVNIIQDERINQLLNTDSIINSQKQSFTGYRIQIFFGGSTDRERAFEIKEEFLELFPEERAYVVYTAPDFRVRVGNFRTKLECIELYKACTKYYPNCYPVKTEIMFSDLVPLEKESEELIVDEEM